MIGVLGRAWIRGALWAGLDGLTVLGDGAVRGLLAEGPVVLAANHVCAWDALVLVEVSRRLGARCHVLMDQGRLEQMPFLGAYGAIGIARGPAARRGLRQATSALQGPGDVLWVFPQGRYRPPHVRPLGLQPGVEWIAKRTGAVVVPTALAYPFREGWRPAGFVHLGAPIGQATLARVEEGLIRGLSQLDQLADTQLSPAPPGLASRALARLTRIGRAA